MSVSLPWLIGHESQFPIDKTKLIEFHNRKYVFWRDQDNVIQALPNACPHNGGSLANGFVKYDNKVSCVRCPFHNQLFDGIGHWHNDNYLPDKVKDPKPLITPLDIINDRGMIWAYVPNKAGNKITIPNFDHILSDSSISFNTMVEPRLINSKFEKILKISYDYDHVDGTHYPYFGITDFELLSFNWNGIDITSRVSYLFEKRTLKEKLLSPVFFFLPNNVEQNVSLFFPTLFVVNNKIKQGNFFTIFYFYPVNDKQSMIGSLIYDTMPKWSNKILQKSAQKSANMIITQDMEETERQEDVQSLISLKYDHIWKKAILMYEDYNNNTLVIDTQKQRIYNPTQ